jgi:uncharacterized protein YndB with AHSA1/START domain
LTETRPVARILGMARKPRPVQEKPPARRSARFEISRVIDAPREFVFNAWTERHPDKGAYRELVRPERLVMTIDCSEYPAEWHARLNKQLGRKTGGKPIGQAVMAASFDDLNGKTKLTIRTSFDSAAIRDALLSLGMREGWARTLERMAEVLAKSAAEREIVATRVFDAPRELVFEAWTDRRSVARWWGPAGFANTIQEMDVRAGGVWRFVLRGPDGADQRNKNVFVEVVKPERLVFDHVTAPRFRAAAAFEEQGRRTKVTLRMIFATGEELAAAVEEFGAVEGARQTLQRLAEHLGRREGAFRP